MINIDAHIKNADWPKRTPDTFADLERAVKYDPKQPRDEKGRFAATYGVVEDLDTVYERITPTEREGIHFVQRLPTGEPAFAFQITNRAGRIRVQTMEAKTPRQGYATRILTHLTELADKHQVTLELTASPFGGDRATRMDSDQLQALYAKHGFVPEPGHDPSLGYMIREPRAATITVEGRQITVVKPKRAASDVLVPLDVAAFDQEFQREQGFYLGAGGEGGIGNRYERFGEYIAQHDSIEAAEVFVHENGRVGFINGRHRYAWLRDQGLPSIPVAMTSESVRNAKKHGYLSVPLTRKYDPNQPRDAEGQWTKALIVTLKKGLQEAESYNDTKFILPDGTRLTHGEETHADATSALNIDLWDAMAAGVMRFTQAGVTAAGSDVGVEVGSRITYAQAQHLVDARIFSGYDGVLVDLFIGNKYFSQRFSDRATAEAIRHWVNSHYETKVAWEEHDYGNTQIQVAPTSSAAASLNMARDAIRDEDCMATGKDVDPNHVTVRYGLLNEDLDELRSFLASQAPFEAQLGQIELFPASEHSDGAVPVVARILSPELHAIEDEIGNHAVFKEKNFPVYKPHCTLAYVKPERAMSYAGLFVHGSFVVQSITISHQSGVQETIPFGLVNKWDASKHPRQPKGSTHGGRFVETLHGPKDALESLLAGEKDVSIDRDDLRRFLELAGEQFEDPDLTDLQVEGMEIFGGNGLGIKREEMPQIPRAHREQFLRELEQAGVKIVMETVDPLTLKPTQTQVSARDVALKMAEYEKGKKKFPPLLISQENRILDGHHHWGMMATLAVDVPTIKVPIYRLLITTDEALALMHAYDKKHGIQRKKLGQKLDATSKADPATGRYVTPFVSFDKQGDEQLRMIASLNSSRLATWGFTAEAEVLGMARYKLTAVLDGRTSEFCKLIDGKVFNVPDAREKVIEVLNVQNPEDLRVVQPWPKQTKQALAEFREMSPAELTERGLHIPPYHPHCRTICRAIPSSAGKVKETVPTTPTGAEAFQAVTQADLKEMGIDATQAQVDQWNAHVGMTPVELLSKLSGLPPQEVMTKGKGVGTKPIQFDPSGNIGFNVKGSSPSGIEFKLGAILDPFTGTYYLSQADLLAGNPKAELVFLKNLFSSLIEMGLKSSATSVAVGVAGNAAYYAKLGFLPDELEWDSLRTFTMGELESDILKPMLASLTPLDRLLVEHLLQDKSVGALSALVELPFVYKGKTIGEWLFGKATGTWALDLTDEGLVAQAQAYLL